MSQRGVREIVSLEALRKLTVQNSTSALNDALRVKVFSENGKREYDGGVGPIRRLSQELSGPLVWIHVA